MHVQLLPRRGSILLPFKNKFFAAKDYNFSSSINFAAFHYMPANGRTGTVADTDTKIRSAILK